MTRNNRIVNIGYVVDGMHFDAAVDCDWQMHAYELKCFGHEPNENETPIELYNLDNTNWDIKMIYWKRDDGIRINYSQKEVKGTYYEPLQHTWCDFDFILQETKKWIEENKGYDKESI
jgi:hypothetical protein